MGTCSGCCKKESNLCVNEFTETQNDDKVRQTPGEPTKGKTFEEFKQVAATLKTTNSHTQDVYNTEGSIDYKPIDDKVKRKLRSLRVAKDNVRYYGYWNVENNLYDGYGVMLWPDGSRYDGMFKDGKITGTGRFIRSNGDVYQGNLENFKANGYGIYKQAGAIIYKGNWKDDRQHGKGTQLWSDGANYEGEFDNGAISGQGTFTWPNKKSYTGNWHNGKEHGRGKLRWTTGSEYEGDWENGTRTGKGSYKSRQGRTQVGMWKDDRQISIVSNDENDPD